jgi:hypothetical protein
MERTIAFQAVFRVFDSVNNKASLLASGIRQTILFMNSILVYIFQWERKKGYLTLIVFVVVILLSIMCRE